MAMLSNLNKGRSLVWIAFLVTLSSLWAYSNRVADVQAPERQPLPSKTANLLVERENANALSVDGIVVGMSRQQVHDRLINLPSHAQGEVSESYGSWGVDKEGSAANGNMCVRYSGVNQPEDRVINVNGAHLFLGQRALVNEPPTSIRKALGPPNKVIESRGNRIRPIWIYNDIPLLIEFDRVGPSGKACWFLLGSKDPRDF